MSKRRNTTSRIELVETHNIALAISRAMMNNGWYSVHWRRALYHGLAIAGASNAQLEKIRVALDLP